MVVRRNQCRPVQTGPPSAFRWQTYGPEATFIGLARKKKLDQGFAVEITIQIGN
jgi:hypothetical protein